MGGETITLTGERETLLITLYAKALESKLDDSLLRDRFAEEIVSRINYDFDRLKVDIGTARGIALRAKSFDIWAEAFISQQQEATVLHLGCGLDSRVFRLDPAGHISWFDIDYPDVIALRRKLYPPRDHCELIGASIIDPDWLSMIPHDRPTLIIAEGLFPYLPELEAPRLIGRLVGYLPGGELIFDGYSRLGLRLLAFNPSIRATGATLQWSLDDPQDLVAQIPRLMLMDEALSYDPAELARIAPGFSIFLPVWNFIPFLRRMGRLLRYRF